MAESKQIFTQRQSTAATLVLKAPIALWRICFCLHQLPPFASSAFVAIAPASSASIITGAAQVVPFIWLYHPQIPELTDLARAFPETSIVLDHFGGPLGVGPYEGQRDAVFAEWQKSIDALAACPNVVAKLAASI